MVVPVVADVARQPETAGERLVIGCGNPTRQDDGVGPWVAREFSRIVAQRNLINVRVVDAGTAGMEVMFAARGAAQLYIVDACRGAGAPGEVFRVPGSEVQVGQHESFTLHDFRWHHALHGGRKIFGDAFPDRVEIFLVEAEALDFGLELSVVAEAGARKVLQLLEDELAVDA